MTAILTNVTWADVDTVVNAEGLTAADAAVAIKGAKDGNIGVLGNNEPAFSGDVSTIEKNGFYSIASTATGIPLPTNGTLLVSTRSSGNVTRVFSAFSTNSQFIQTSSAGVESDWQELYHTGNTGVTRYGGANPDGSGNDIVFSPAESTAGIYQGVASTVTRTIQKYFNPNGLVGGITLLGSATSFLTSSDPRLKDFLANPTDADIDDKFNDLYSTFRLFSFKSDSNGDVVWGFDAHACVDAGLDMGSEGEGDRGLNIGDKYKDAVLDEEGKEIEPALYVTPAGVDQSKAVPILLAKLEQLERRLKALES